MNYDVLTQMNEASTTFYKGAVRQIEGTASAIAETTKLSPLVLQVREDVEAISSQAKKMEGTVDLLRAYVAQLEAQLLPRKER